MGRCRLNPGFAVDPTLAFRDFQLLKLKHDELLSSFVFNYNLRHYTTGDYAGARAAYLSSAAEF